MGGGVSVIRTALEFEGHFTQLPNAWLRDSRLSWRARGILAGLASHRIGWKVTLASIVEGGAEGRDAVATALRELEDHGYLERTQDRDEQNRFKEIEYRLADPWHGNPVPGNPYAGKPVPGNPHPKKNKEEHQQEEHQEEQVVAQTATAVARPEGDLIPEDWRPTQKQIDFAASLNLDVSREAQRFIEHARRVHRRQKNWNTAFTNWLRKGAELAQQRGTSPSVPRARVDQNLAEYQRLYGQNGDQHARARSLPAAHPGIGA